MRTKQIEAKKHKKGHYIEPVFGVPIFSGSREEVLRTLTDKMNKKAIGKPLFVVTLNTEMLMISQKDGEFRQVLNEADMLVPDSVGLKLLGKTNVYPGRGLVKDILDIQKYRLMYMSTEKDLAWEKGMQSGSKAMKGKYGGEFADAHDIKKVNKYKPDLLLVAFGAPEQEKWIYKNKNKLKCKVVIGVGGTFDYLLGLRSLPPKWMEKMGLEWLWRLVRQPWRWKRQIKLMLFVCRLLKFRLKVVFR